MTTEITIDLLCTLNFKIKRSVTQLVPCAQLKCDTPALIKSRPTVSR